MMNDNFNECFAEFPITYDKKTIYNALRNENYFWLPALITISVCILITVIVIGFRCAIFYDSYGADDLFVSMLISNIMLFLAFIACSVVSICMYKKLCAKVNAIKNNESYNESLIKAYQDHIEIIGANNDEVLYSIAYANVSSITQTEEYYIFHLKSKSVYITEKSKSTGDLNRLFDIAYAMRKDRKRSLLKSDDNTNKIQNYLKIKNTSVVLFVSAIASLWISSALATMFLGSGQSVNDLSGFQKFFSSTCMMYFLVFPISSLMHGIKYSRKINIIAGLVMTVFILLFGLLLMFGVLHVN